MSKRYRKPSVPRTKRTLIGYDKMNDVPVVIDTNVPDLSGSREPQQSFPDGEKFLWTCRHCEATTRVGQKVCSTCNKDIDKVIDNVERQESYEQHECSCCKCDRLTVTDDEISYDYSDCDCICEHKPQNINAVTDAQWKPNRYDTLIVETDDKFCIVCFIALPTSVKDSWRKCEMCRA